MLSPARSLSSTAPLLPAANGKRPSSTQVPAAVAWLLAALFGGEGFARSFVTSATAFARNAGAFLVYGIVALALLAIGLATMGIGLVIALPLIACATWAAWREVCPAEATPSAPG